MRNFALLALFQVLTLSAGATNPEFTKIPQPANLVGESLAGCIPLTEAITYHNYRLGIHRLISESRPFLHGAKEWEKGTEANHNLASVFGIIVRPKDDMPVPFSPVEIHIKDWPAPAYSPHTKADVLAATIHCLLLSSHPSPDHPLDIQIKAENKKDESWTKPFQKKYITRPGEDQKPVIVTPVGNSIVKTDGFGIRYIINPTINPTQRTPKSLPLLLPVFGDSLSLGEIAGSLIPVWSGSEPKLDLLAKQNSFYYNLFTSGQTLSREFNPFLGNNNAVHLSVRKKEEYLDTRISCSCETSASLSMAIAALVISAKQLHQKPVKITISAYSEDNKLPEIFKRLPGWEETKTGSRNAFTAIFDYDPETRKLMKSSLPGNLRIKSNPEGAIYFDHLEK